MNDPTTSCVSDLRFDRMLACELEEDEVATIEAHAEACEGCGQRLASLRRSELELRAELPSLPSPAVPPPSNVRWLAVAAVVSTLAAAVLLAWWGRGDDLRPAPAPRVATRLKGGASVHAVVRRGDRTFAMSETDIMSPGDVVALSYTRVDDGFVAVFDVDGEQIRPVYPRGTQTVPAPAGRDVELDVAFELDDSPREEWLVLVFCEKQARVDDLHEALQVEPNGKRLPAGCAATRISLLKEAR